MNTEDATTSRRPVLLVIDENGDDTLLVGDESFDAVTSGDLGNRIQQGSTSVVGHLADLRVVRSNPLAERRVPYPVRGKDVQAMQTSDQLAMRQPSVFLPTFYEDISVHQFLAYFDAAEVI